MDSIVIAGIGVIMYTMWKKKPPSESANNDPAWVCAAGLWVHAMNHGDADHY